MAESVIIFFFIILLEIPFTLIHELGHAIPYLLFSKDAVKVQMGDGDISKKLSAGRLIIEFRGYKSLLGITYGRVFGAPLDNRIKAIAVFLSGPFVSLIISIISLITIKNNLEENYLIKLLLSAVFWSTMGKGIVTLMPVIYSFYPYKSVKSDGYRILQLIRNKY